MNDFQALPMHRPFDIDPTPLPFKTKGFMVITQSLVRLEPRIQRPALPLPL
jgi:hypothetical protein